MGLTDASGSRDQGIQEHHNPRHRAFAAQSTRGFSVNQQSVLAKTKKGAEEIETRQFKLDQRMRALLLVVNGKVTVRDLVANYARLGNVPEMLRQLTALGFVGEVTATNVQPEIAALVLETLGPEAMSIAQEVEQCESVADLRAYFESRREMFDRAMIKPRAEAFWKKVNKLLQ